MPKRLLVLHPFRPDYEKAFDLVRRAAAATGQDVEIVRGSLARDDETPVEAFLRVLQGMDLVVCDISEPNPNVMLELGHAQALRKPIVLITGSLDFIPFELRGTVVHWYRFEDGSADEFVSRFSRTLVEAFQNPSAFVDQRRFGNGKNAVFISYSHTDSEYLTRVLVHLKPLERLGLVDLWVDLKIKAGDRWRQEVTEALDNARIAVLLVSADFLASDFIVDNELPPLLRAAEEKGTRVLPVILKPCRFLRDSHLSRFQAVNDPARPVVLLSVGEQEAIYDKVAQTVEAAVGH